MNIPAGPIGISRRRLLASAGLGTFGSALASLGSNSAFAAQEYPDQPIKFIVPYAPGATTDLVMRMASRHVADRLGQPVVLESRPGAGGAVGMSSLSKATPNGYTIGATSGSMLIATPLLNENLSFSPADFAFISLLANVPFVLTVNPSLPVHTPAELLKYVASNKDRLSYGSVAVGHYAHVAMMEVNEQTGAGMVHAPYKGEALIVQDLLAGQLQLGFFSPSSIKPMADAGKVRLLAVSGAKRLKSMPDVPTLLEVGWTAPIFRMNAGWLGVVAPARTPQPIMRRLTAEYVAAIRDPQINNQIAEVGLDPVGSTAEQFAATYATELPLWRGLLKKAGLELRGETSVR